MRKTCTTVPEPATEPSVSRQIVDFIDHVSEKLEALYALTVAIGNDINPEEGEQRTPSKHHHTLINFMGDEIRALSDKVSADLQAIADRA